MVKQQLNAQQNTDMNGRTDEFLWHNENYIFLQKKTALKSLPRRHQIATVLFVQKDRWLILFY